MDDYTGMDHIIKIVSQYMDVAAMIGAMMDTGFDRDTIDRILYMHCLTVGEICAKFAEQMTEDQVAHFTQEVDMIQGGKMLLLEAEQLLGE